ncbi:LacI family DNA-binding transcriptional regulator [Arthrobacter sp. JCM 19049]|uniref:LacI family DNA-binding transcriptional regulator n=1 Tax=Arthrobacter sp. JCM 19049 TaxID=1460643 RepID=UPI000A7EB366|nr:LacI family DNA-binding transcriptional regulator [Arthrobacter sp. JCM 19049]
MARRQGTGEVTISDVARRAGVSKAQAARAMGGYGSVSSEVKQLVMQAAQELRYRPNALARSINTGKSQSIGVVVGDVENPYFGQVIRGISDVARHHDYDVVLANTGESLQDEEKAVKVLLDKRVDGLLICPTSRSAHSHILDAERAGRPVVLFDRDISVPALDVVQMSIAEVTSQVIDSLIDAGHRRIAYISTLKLSTRKFVPGQELDLSTVTQRVDGICLALKRSGIEIDPGLFRFGATDREAMQQLVEELMHLSSPPTALVASDSLVALDLLSVLRRRDLRVPTDISVVMLDDQPWAELVEPPITSVFQPAYDLGEQAAGALFERIEGTTGGRRIWLTPNLVHRSSVAPPPGWRELDR